MMTPVLGMPLGLVPFSMLMWCSSVVRVDGGRPGEFCVGPSALGFFFDFYLGLRLRLVWVAPLALVSGEFLFSLSGPPN